MQRKKLFLKFVFVPLFCSLLELSQAESQLVPIKISYATTFWDSLATLDCSGRATLREVRLGCQADQHSFREHGH